MEASPPVTDNLPVDPPMDRAIALINACLPNESPDAAKALAQSYRDAGVTDRELGSELLNVAVRLLLRLEELGRDADEELLALAVQSDAPWVPEDHDDPDED